MFQFFASDARIYAQDVLSFSLCAIALIWGAMPERIIAATWLLVFELGLRIYGSVSDIDYAKVDWGVASFDLAAGIIWIAVALYANRNYPLWIAGLQVLAILGHVAEAFADTISPIAYLVMIVAPSWLQLFALGIGLTRHIKRKRKFGSYREWRVTGNQSPIFAGLNKTGTDKRPDVAHSDHSWRDDLK